MTNAPRPDSADHAVSPTKTRQTRRALHGWINLDKPVGLTSTRAVGRLKHLFAAKKVGHAGTLDPLASGVLPLAFGEATKTVSYMMEAAKEYEFVIRWGIRTRTEDREGEVVERSDRRPEETEIEDALNRFVGDIDQTPPEYSAIKVDGARAYDLARQGQEVTLKARRVTVFDACLTAVRDRDHAAFRLSCGKGFYIRALARDLAAALGTFGHIVELRRTRVGAFSIDGAISLEKLDELSHSADFLQSLLPVEMGLDDIPALRMTGAEAQRLKRGQPVSLTRTHVNQLGGRTRAYVRCGASPVAVGDIRAGRFHPTRVFNIPLKGTMDVDYS